MLDKVGVESIDQLIQETVPPGIRLKKPLSLPEAKTETQFLKDFRVLADKNRVFKSFIGLGYYESILPNVVQRNILENPAWYTAYTPYQAEIAQGTAQRFGIQMGLGGPHAAFYAVTEAYKRQIPGRIIGLSKDAQGNDAYRMALQTREQHIRREKATSNICTSQVLLAVLSAAYAIYHGSEGLKAIAERTHGLARFFANSVQGLDFKINNEDFFDTVSVEVNGTDKLKELAEAKGINLRYVDEDTVCVSFDEGKTLSDVGDLLEIFAETRGDRVLMSLKGEIESGIPNGLKRTSPFMTHDVFNTHHTEHEMLRYLKTLENKDLSLVHSMISLGSCTMKLNATAEMIPVTWPEIGGLHPFAPANQTEGYHEIFKNLQEWLAEITGFDAVSLQPNSGAQGEYAGLMVIRAFHESRGDTERNIALIPSSAHGTNPASAVMAGMKVVVTACDENGNIDIDDLKAKTEKYSENLACL
eukprot:maker-scaffold3187_size9834-snap-gene-0.1 protein:Tk06881 transcript:maker-scaffold3187_size9834-snap-gene-0.1-mRNA-1 annotation:"glycine dehydrogenase"